MPGQGTTLLPYGKVTREVRNPGATAGFSVWGQGLLQERSGTPVEPVSLQPLHSPELEPAGSTGSKSLLAPTARSTESLTPAECHKSQLLPRPVLFTPFPGAESQVGKMLWTPSWVICIPHAGSQSMFLGPPPIPATPLPQGTVSPRSHTGTRTGTGVYREVSSSVLDRVPGTGSQSEGASWEVGTASALAALRRHQHGTGHAHQ